MIASLHLADVGLRPAMRVLAMRLDRSSAPGLVYAQTMVAAPLGSNVLPRPRPGRIALFAAWENDRSAEAFIAGHPLAARLAHGWRVRLQPTRVFGAWPPLPGLPADEIPMDPDEPAAVLTLGRLRLSQTPRFLRASAAAEGRALRDRALLASTGLARPPSLVATFSLWRCTAPMRAYAEGREEGAQHRAAVRAHTTRPFHHHAAFIRFRPYRAEGAWDGINPLR